MFLKHSKTTIEINVVTHCSIMISQLTSQIIALIKNKTYLNPNRQDIAPIFIAEKWFTQQCNNIQRIKTSIPGKGKSKASGAL
jgi:hypothetical protein